MPLLVGQGTVIRRETHDVATPVRRHVIAIARLPLHALDDFLVVGGIPRVVIVLHERHEHGATFPPSIGDLARNFARFISFVMLHHAVGGG